MRKDIDLLIEAARKAGADVPAASLAQSILASKVSSRGDLDLPAITPFLIAQGSRAEVERVRAPTSNRSGGK